MGQFLPLIFSAVAAGAQKKENDRVIRNQEEAANTALVKRTERQARADERVDQQVEKVAQSRSEDERAQRLGEYLGTLERGKRTAQAGLTPTYGSQTFQNDSATAAANVMQGAQDRAGLLARIDAPLLQRQGEGFDYGRTATDLGLIQRQVAGDQFVDDLLMRRAGRRNTNVDFLSGVASGLGSAMAGGASGAAGGGIGPVVKQPLYY